MIKKLTFLGLLFSLISCATPGKPHDVEISKYMKSIGSKIEPVWKEEVKTRVRNLASRGLKPIPLPSPNNEILVSIDIAPDGAIKEIKPINKSRYAFLNQSAIKVLNLSSPLAPPPSSCVKENICRVAWRFIVDP